MAILRAEGPRLVRSFDGETLQIEPWGENSLRVRAWRGAVRSGEDWALLPPPEQRADIRIDGQEAALRNGNIEAHLNAAGLLTVKNSRGELLLREYWRNRAPNSDRYSALNIEAREFKPITGGDYRLTARFESLSPEEKIFGMGQYQDGFLDHKGCTLELAHRNSQASVPFAVSSLGYGFFWNNPAIGSVSFAKNLTEWTAESTKQLDYWITAGDTPKEIVAAYAAVTGRPPRMPDYALGFWQCKLRYETQEELLSVAREYKRRGLPLSVIVADFFHWPYQGDWRFDEKYWPDVDAMTAELKELGVELMVSVWPTVDFRSENYAALRDRGYLVRPERGVGVTMRFCGDTLFFDPTAPGARKFLWSVLEKNYASRGIRMFWLDEAEPEYSVYDYDNYRYAIGPVLQTGNIYPVEYTRAIYEGLAERERGEVISLVRSAWAGSQRYGALVWSGDIGTTWESLRDQLKIGLNMGFAGVPWWTTDIGGFGGGNPTDEAYRELFIRWFQFGAFCPVFRLHGDREVIDENAETTLLDSENGALAEYIHSGGPNEVWSYGERAYPILVHYLKLRERMRPYLRALMDRVHETGEPALRACCYEFPGDPVAWTLDDQYLFGPDLLVAPVLEPGAAQRRVWLPAGAFWIETVTGTRWEGGQWIDAAAPLERIPVFLRDGRGAEYFEET